MNCTRILITFDKRVVLISTRCSFILMGFLFIDVNRIPIEFIRTPQIPGDRIFMFMWPVGPRGCDSAKAKQNASCFGLFLNNQVHYTDYILRLYLRMIRDPQQPTCLPARSRQQRTSLLASACDLSLLRQRPPVSVDPGRQDAHACRQEYMQPNVFASALFSLPIVAPTHVWSRIQLNPL